MNWFGGCGCSVCYCGVCVVVCSLYDLLVCVCRCGMGCLADYVILRLFVVFGVWLVCFFVCCRFVWCIYVVVFCLGWVVCVIVL